MNVIQYVYSPVILFSDKLEEIRVSDPAGYIRIKKVIDRLLINPDDADGKMHGLYNGRLKKYVGRSGYRLIYYWCKLCQKESNHILNSCGHNCKSILKNSVVFLDVYHKNNSNKL